MRLIRRVVNLFVCAGALVVLSPLLIATAVGILPSSGPPVLFRQRRIGLRQREFVLYKFRAMIRERDDAGNLPADERRLTAFRCFLRSTSLDDGLANTVRWYLNCSGTG